MKALPDLFIDEQELEERGFTLLPNLVSAADLAEFERVIGELCSAEIKRREITPQYADPFIDVMLADEDYRRYLFPLLRRFFILERISAQIGARLTQNGFLARHGHRAPMIWPFFRADLPNEKVYELGFHQDLISTESAKAWRIWLPLRDVDRHFGSMELVSGSHKLGWLEHRAKASSVEALIDEASISKESLVSVELPAGDAVLFHPGIIHRSVPNRSQRVKFVLLVQVQDGAELLGPDKNQPSQEPSIGAVSLIPRDAINRHGDAPRHSQK